MTSKKKTPSKVAVRDASQNEAVKSRISTITAESALQNLGTAQASVGRTLATVGEKVQEQLQVLGDVKKVVALTQLELEELHGKDAVLRSIDELRADRDAMAVQLERDRERVQLAFEVEQANFSRQSAENHAQLEHEFATSKLSARAAFDAEVHLAKVTERDRREAVERDFQIRSEALKARETELAQLKAQVEAFPAQLKAEVAAAAAATAGSLKRDYEHQLSDAKRDLSQANQLSHLQVETLSERNGQLTQQLEAANQRVEAANSKVAEIAQKALDSASGQRTLTEMQNFATKESNNGAGRKT